MKEIKVNQVWINSNNDMFVITGREKGKFTAMKFCNNKLSSKKMYIDEVTGVEDKKLIGLLKTDFIVEKKIIRRLNGNN